MMEKAVLKAVLAAQRNEITEYHVYSRLAKMIKSEKNAQILRDIAEAERRHAAFWEAKTNVKVQPKKFKVWKTVLQARILGLTFVLKRMEKNEGTASRRYLELEKTFPELADIRKEEDAHEQNLLGMLDEQLLQYVGSIVLGLNDALVELTGALAGFTLALGDTKLISLAGLVTGISAAFSMAASDYLSSKAEGNKNAGTSALYTGLAYLVTVVFLILPFLLISEKFISLVITLAIAVIIIFLFNYYISIAKDYDFKKRFLEMAAISLGVAAFSFALGWLLKILLGVDV